MSRLSNTFKSIFRLGDTANDNNKSNSSLNSQREIKSRWLLDIQKEVIQKAAEEKRQQLLKQQEELEKKQREEEERQMQLEEEKKKKEQQQEEEKKANDIEEVAEDTTSEVGTTDSTWTWGTQPIVTVDYESQEPSEKTRKERRQEALAELREKYWEQNKQTLQSIKADWIDLLDKTEERFSDWQQFWDLFTTGVQEVTTIWKDILKLLGMGINNIIISPIHRLEKEEEETRYWDWLSKNKQLLFDAADDGIAQTEAEKQLNSVWDSIKDDFTWYQWFFDSAQEKSAQVVKIDEQIQIAKDTWASQEAIDALMEKRDKLTLEYYRDFYEYTFGQEFEWNTLKDLLLNVQAKTNKKYTIKQLEEQDVEEYNKKLMYIGDWLQKIEQIKTDYEIRSNYNVWELPVEATIATLESYWLVLTDTQKNMIARPYADIETILQTYDARIKSAQDDWDTKLAQQLIEEKQRVKQWMSYFTEMVEYGANEIAKKQANKYDMADLILKLYSSNEALLLKRFLTDPNLYRSCLKEDWTLDYVKLWEKIERSTITQDFWALAWWYKQTAKRQFFQDKADSDWTFKSMYWSVRLWWFDRLNNSKLYNLLPTGWPQWGWRYLLWGYEKAIMKYLDDWGSINWMTWEWDQEWDNEYLNSLLWFGSDYNFNLISDKKKKKIAAEIAKLGWSDIVDAFIMQDVSLARSQWDKMTDPIVQQIKNTDALYAQNYWAQFFNWLEKISDTFQAYPADTIATTAAVMLPFAWWADKIAAWIKVLPWLEKINWWTAIGKMWAEMVWEAIEWEIINIMLDSTTYWDPEPIWNLLDLWVWALKWVKYIKEVKGFWEFKSVLKWTVNGALPELENIKGYHWAAPKLSDLTNWEKDILNEAFRKDDWLWIINGKDFTDYLKEDLSVDFENMYRDFSKNAPLFLWSTKNQTMQALYEKVVDKAYADEILSWTKTADADKIKQNQKMIDALYRKALRSINDKALLRELMKGSKQLTWKQNVIKYWLTQQTNTLSKIWKAKMWFNIANFVEQSSKWAFSAINAEMKNTMESLQKMYDSAPNELKPIFQNLMDRASELYTNRKMLPLYVSDRQIDAALKLDKVKTEEFKKAISDAIVQQLSKSKETELANDTVLRKIQNELKAISDGWLSPVGREIIDAWLSGDKELFSRLVLWNKKEAEKLWIKTYTVDQYNRRIKKMAWNTLNSSQKSRLNQLLKVLDWVNNKTLNIIELPENIRNIVVKMQWFMGYTKEWDNAVIALSAGLVWVAENGWFDFVKVAWHELWHLIFGSLSKSVKSQIALWLISLLDWKKMTSALLKRIVSDLPDARIAELQKIYKEWKEAWDLTKFVEELCADTISFSIKNAINWTTDSITKNWDAIIEQLKKWKKIKVGEWDTVSDVLWSKFVDMLEALYTWISKKRWVQEFHAIMNYVAASIIEWKEVSTAGLKWKSLKNLQKKAGALWRKDYAISSEFRDYSYWNVSSTAKYNWKTIEDLEEAALDWVSDYDAAAEAANIQDLLYYMEEYNVPVNRVKEFIWEEEWWQRFSWAEKELDNFTLDTPSPSFLEYKEAEKKVAKADYWFQKNYWEELATLDKNITNFDIAKVYSTTIMRNMLTDSSISYKQLWMMMSNKWLTTEARQEILKYASKSDIKKFNKAVEFAEERQKVVATTLMEFWKDWKIDLNKKVNWYTFADVLNNVSVRITKNWAVEFAWWDLMKFINSSDKALYEQQFYDFMSELIPEYTDEVIANIKEKLIKAGIDWSDLWEKYASDDLAAMWVVFSNKIENSIKEKAIEGWIEATQADLLAKDVVSRMFVGSFYHMGNIYHMGDFNPEKLVDDWAYWLVTKNKAQSMWDHYTTLYDVVESQYKVAGVDPNFAYRITESNITDMADVMKWAWVSDFRRFHYTKDVFNRLAARNEEFIILSLKKLWLDKWFINIDKKNWVAFINKIFAKQSQAKTLIWDKLAAKWLNAQVLWIYNKLDWAVSTKEVADVYIDALSNGKNADIAKIISDEERKNLISELEKIKTDWFSDSDYEDLYNVLQWKYMLNGNKTTSLDDYFVGVLNKEQIKELNDTNAQYAKSSVNSMPQERPTDFKEEFNWIWKYLDKAEVKNGIDNIMKKINDWNNVVDEWRAEWLIPILDYALQDKTLESFFKFKDEKAKRNLQMKLTNSSMKWARKVVFDMTEESNVWKATWLKKILYSFINLTSVSAQEKEVWWILTKWIDFVNWTSVYVWDWPFKEFFDAIWFIPEKKFVGIENVINQIIKTLDWSVKNGMTFENFANEVVDRYSSRFRNISWTSVINRKKVLSSDEMFSAGKNYFGWWYIPKTVEEATQYDAAINAYIEILSKRHWEMWWLSKGELNTIMWNINMRAPQSKIVAQWSQMAQESSKLLWLKWYWLWLSVDEMKKLDDVAAVWHPDMFKNYLYKAYAKTSETFTTWDIIKKGIRATENSLSNVMYTLYYNILWAWWSTASQQVMTNALEITSKTLWEFADIDIDPRVFNEVMWLVWDLIPSEIMKSTRAELDIYNLWGSIKSAMNKTNALAYADKATERMVMQYALTSSLIDMWFNWQSTKELLSSILENAKKLEESMVKEYWDSLAILWSAFTKTADWKYKLNLSNLITTDSKQFTRSLNRQLKRLREWGSISETDIIRIEKSLLDFNDQTEPLREAAKQANYKKNAFYQISQIPELTQNVIWGWAWPANMRFINWASRKAWEYTYNIASAIRRWDKQKLYQYATALIYRWLLATKIYAQVDKATSNTWGVNYSEFMKMMVLPYAAFNMAFLSALDIVWDSIEEWTNWGSFKEVAWVAANWLIGTADNLKWRISSTWIFWLWKALETINWTGALSEKQSASDYFSWVATSIPIINYIEEILWKVFTNRLTRTTTLKWGWLFKNDIALFDSDILINLLAGWTVTNNTVELNKLRNDINNSIYEEGSWWDIAITLINGSKDSRYAYMALNKYLYDSWLDEYITPWTTLDKLQEEFDKLYNQSRFMDSLGSLWLDAETYQNMLMQDFNNEWNWTSIAWYEHLKKIWANTPRADAILNMAIMSNAAMYWFFEAWKWISIEDRNYFEENTNQIYEEILQEVQDREKTNPKSLKEASYNQDAIQLMIEKYGNQYWEEILIATTIKALVTEYGTNLRKDLKDWAKWPDYYKMKYWLTDTERFNWLSLDEYIAVAKCDYKNQLVKEYYDTLIAWNEFIWNKMMFSHAAMKEDYPLSAELNLNSSLWTTFDVEWLKTNVERQWLSALWVNGILPEYAVKVMNSKNIDMKQKLEFIDRELELAWQYWAFMEDRMKWGLSYPLLDHFIEIANDPDWREWLNNNAEWLARKMKQYTVSRPLSNDDIKEQVRSSIFKQNKSWSWSWRRWSLSFKPLADRLTKFQAFKRQLERNVMDTEPLDLISYKPTSKWVTPIRLTVWEAKAIDEKYSFLKPMSFETPKSEKTPDLVVKQVKTTSSKYSGKAIKQSNVYKVKKVL